MASPEILFQGRLNGRSRHSWLMLVILFAAGFAGNFFSLRLFTGFNYLFGSIPVLLVLSLYGPRWGLVAGAVASSWTITLFGHPYAMIWLCGEPLFVGWLLTKGRTRNIILYDTLYWPLIGGPLIWIFFQHAMRVPALGTMAAILMYWVIGVANAVIASLLLSYVPGLASMGGAGPRTIPIHRMIFNLLMAIVLIPALLIMIINGKALERQQLSNLYEGIQDSARFASYEVRGASQQGIFDPGAPSERLEAARAKTFFRILLLDGANHILASSAADRIGSVYAPCPDGEATAVEGEPDTFRCLPGSRTLLPLWQRAGKGTYYSRLGLGDGTGRVVVAETQFAPYQRLLLRDHIKALLVVLMLNVLVLAASLYASRRLASPLLRLSRLTTDLPQKLLHEEVTEWPESLVTEIDQLIGNSRVMARALKERFQDISTAKETLEARVAERTSALTRANAELQHEIAERKATERQRDHLMEELVTNLGLLQTIIDAIPNPVFFKDANGLYQGCNRAFEECWGLTQAQIAGKSVHDLFPPEAAEVFFNADQALFRKRGVQVYETQTVYKTDGLPHSVIFYKATYDDAQGNLAGLVGTVVDITKRKQAETERDRLMVELKRKNKELESIIYVASHDLRSPLVNVQGFSRKLVKNCADLQRLLAGVALEPEQRMHLEQYLTESIPRSLHFITGSIEKMDTLLGGLLRLSRLGRAALCFDRLEMKEILDKIIASMAYQIDAAGADIVLEDLLPCHADAGQVVQVFSNLLDNALKYRSPERGLEIRISSIPVPEGVRYCVTDNGIGIAPGDQEKIWEMFHRLSLDGPQGEGLGLTMARRIVDMLGGGMWVESEPGCGSRFYVVLPPPAPTPDRI